MFSWFKKKNPLEKLEKAYYQALEEARDLRRKGDVRAAAEKDAEAERLAIAIEAWQKENPPKA